MPQRHQMSNWTMSSQVFYLPYTSCTFHLWTSPLSSLEARFQWPSYGARCEPHYSLYGSFWWPCILISKSQTFASNQVIIICIKNSIHLIKKQRKHRIENQLTCLYHAWHLKALLFSHLCQGKCCPRHSANWAHHYVVVWYKKSRPWINDSRCRWKTYVLKACWDMVWLQSSLQTLHSLLSSEGSNVAYHGQSQSSPYYSHRIRKHKIH